MKQVELPEAWLVLAERGEEYLRNGWRLYLCNEICRMYDDGSLSRDTAEDMKRRVDEDLGYKYVAYSPLGNGEDGGMTDEECHQARVLAALMFYHEACDAQRKPKRASN